MPSDEEVLDTKLWTLAKYLDDKDLREHFSVLFVDLPAEVVEVRIDMGSSPYKVTLVCSVSQHIESRAFQAAIAAGEAAKNIDPELLAEFLEAVATGRISKEELERAADSAVEKESSEGDVRSGGRAGQPGADTSSAGSDAADSSGPA